jgi:hypothetical protein
MTLLSELNQYYLQGDGTAARTHPLASLLTGLEAWYTMDETSGVRADSHTNGHDLLDFNGVSYTVNGIQGNCADFTAANQQLYYSSSSDNHPFDDLSEFSFAAWVKADSYSASMDTINVRDGVGLANIAWSLQYYSGYWRLYVPDGSTDRHAAWGSSPTIDTWYFIYGYYKGADNEIGISVNNGSIVTGTGPSAMNDVGPSSNYLRLGSGPSSTNPFNGKLDEVAIWNRKLTTVELIALYNSGRGATYTDITA